MLDAANDLKSKLSDPSLLTDKAYVAGEWVAADDGGTFEVRNPSTGDVLAHVADLGRAETARAIDAAEKAGKEEEIPCPKVCKFHGERKRAGTPANFQPETLG